MHGFAADRANLSPLARSLARAGHAVLAVDVAGHGANRRGSFQQARARRGPFFDELERQRPHPTLGFSFYAIVKWQELRGKL